MNMGCINNEKSPDGQHKTQLKVSLQLRLTCPSCLYFLSAVCSIHRSAALLLRCSAPCPAAALFLYILLLLKA